TKIDADALVRSKFSIEYLKKMIQGSKLAEKATVRLSQDYPIKIEFTEVNKLHLAFILAPRVDND
ncbi:MAG: DNA polymerase sliding clamp, partial [Nitrosarchaeum sp.]|nr:DNA polymerase sliding clamp [Nitrosarchaeum sp.]